MKSQTGFFVLICLIFLTFLSGCGNNLLPAPDISDNGEPGSAAGSPWGSPSGLIASHGLKGEVMLTWQPVKGADRYYVYSADSPSDTPVQAGAAADVSCIIKEKAGVTKYYRVTAVKDSGKESPAGTWVLGTTLARPQITSITPKEGSETSTVIVNWWMSNLSENLSSYEDKVSYIVSIKDQTTNKELEPINTTENLIEVTGLTAKTSYLFKVTAYITSDSEKKEESEWIDQETARRMKPEAPGNLSATKGLYTDKVELSWTIPDELVEYPAGDGSYNTLQIFFKIYRRAKGDMNWNLLNIYKIATDAYLPGGVVSWTDGSNEPANYPKTDTQYEYKVQSFADTGKIEVSSDNSAAETEGWILNQAIFSINSKRNPEAETVTVNFSTDWNNFDFEEDKYTVKIGTQKADIAAPPSQDTEWADIAEIDAIKVKDIASEEKVFNFIFDEGYYRFIIKLYYDSGADAKQTYTSSSVTVTGRYTPQTPEVTVREGWTDKTIIKWTVDTQATAYELERSEIETGVKEPIDISSAQISANGLICTFEDSGLDSGKSYYYELKARSDEDGSVYSDIVRFEAGTLGIPAPVFSAESIDYKQITLTWNKVARTKEGIPYTVSYVYDGDGGRERQISLDEHNFNISNEGICTLTFVPEESDNAAYSGKTIKVNVRAESNESVSPAGSVSARTLGPALTNVAATAAEYADKIEVTWNAIEGASGYLVTRTLDGSGNNEDVYYINSAQQVQLQVNPDPVLLESGFVSVKFENGTYTLSDFFNKDISSGDDSIKGYYNRQSTMPWGNTYIYTVTPLKNTDTSLPADLVMRGQMPSGKGHVLGYGLNVAASKARDAGNVIITWDNPPNTPEDVEYTLYRQEEGTTLYLPVNTAVRGANKTEFIDTPENKNGAYTYLVGIYIKGSSVHSDPREDNAFRTAFGGTEKSSNFGYTLNAPVLTATKGNDPALNAAYAEKILWNAPVAGKNARGADGYELEFRNLNLPANADNNGWYTLEIISNPLSGERTYTKDNQLNGLQMLKVLRDYKHYYRIRAYNGDGEDRVYSDYSAEDWGARQVTNLEFTKMSLIAMSVGMYKVRGTSGSGSDGNSSYPNLSSSSSYQWATDYKVSVSYTSWQSMSKPFSSNNEVESVVINGTLMARGGLAGAYQSRYWTDNSITITYLGSDGSFSVEGDGGSKTSGSTTRTSGSVTTSWNGETVKYDMSSSGFNIPFAFPGGYLNDTEEWK